MLKEILEELNESGKIVVYDNGEGTLDRYTVIIGDDFYGMSSNPTEHNGFNQYIGSSQDGYSAGKHLGKKLSKIPTELKQAIKDRQTQ